MKMISTRDLKLKAADTWRLLGSEGELVVTSHGKPVALLADIPGGDVEAALSALRRARAQIAVSSMRRSAQEAGLDGMTAAEVEEEIKAARRARRRS